MNTTVWLMENNYFRDVISSQREVISSQIQIIKKLKSEFEKIANEGDGSTSGDGHSRCKQIARDALNEINLVILEE